MAGMYKYVIKEITNGDSKMVFNVGVNDGYFLTKREAEKERKKLAKLNGNNYIVERVSVS